MLFNTIGKKKLLSAYVLLECLSRFLDKVVAPGFLGLLMANREIHPTLSYSILKSSKYQFRNGILLFTYSFQGLSWEFITSGANH